MLVIFFLPWEFVPIVRCHLSYQSNNTFDCSSSRLGMLNEKTNVWWSFHCIVAKKILDVQTPAFAAVFDYYCFVLYSQSNQNIKSKPFLTRQSPESWQGWTHRSTMDAFLVGDLCASPLSLEPQSICTADFTLCPHLVRNTCDEHRVSSAKSRVHHWL